MRLILVRHGESEGNVIGLFEGNTGLSKNGLNHVKKLSERMKNEKIDLIISSDLIRARDTAKAIERFHPDVELVLDKRLRERFLGKMVGKTDKEIVKPEGISWNDFFKKMDAESDEEIMKRAGDFVEDVFDLGKENVLLVGHYGIFRAVMACLLGKSFEEMKKKKGVDNASFSVVEGDGVGEMKLKLLNSVEHLG